MMVLGNLEFDRPPKPQHKKSNYFGCGILLFGFAFFLFIAINNFIVLRNEQFLRFTVVSVTSCLSLFFLLAAYDGFSELRRISQIEHLLNGHRKDRDQLIIGTYDNEKVNFYISNPPCINYAIQINGQKALAQKELLKRLITQELQNTKLPPYKIRVTKSDLILSRCFLGAFQIKPNNTAAFYDIMIKAKKHFDL